MEKWNVRIKKIRKLHNLTQKQVAISLGIAEQAYQRYEYGKVSPGIDFLLALADFYKVSLDYLVGRSDDPEMK